MSSKVIITSDFPTLSEVAARLGISPAREAELRQMVDEIHSAHARKRVNTNISGHTASRKPAQAKKKST